MAQRALDAFENGEINFIQKSQYEKEWRKWLMSTGAWCISRQIWWGHRIPAYKVTNNETR